MSHNHDGITWGKALKGIAKFGVAIAVAVGFGWAGLGIAEYGFGVDEPFSKLVAYGSAVGAGLLDVPNQVAETLGLSGKETYPEISVAEAQEVSREPLDKAVEEFTKDTGVLSTNSALTTTLENIDNINKALQSTGLASAYPGWEAILETAKSLDPEVIRQQLNTLDGEALKTYMHGLYEKMDLVENKSAEILEGLAGTVADNIQHHEEIAAKIENIPGQHGGQERLLEKNNATLAAFKGVQELLSPTQEVIASAKASLGELGHAVKDYLNPSQSGISTTAAVAGGAGAAALTGAAAYGVGRRGGVKDGAEAVIGQFTQRIAQERQAQQLAALMQQGKGT